MRNGNIKAINYENKKQDRARYIHPDISHKVISQYYLPQDVKSVDNS